MPSNRRLPALLPITNTTTSSATPSPTPATSNLAQPVAEYAIRVRNAARQIVGELSQFQSAGFTLRYNNVSAWMVQIDANDPLADALAADGAGIQVLRVLRDPATGARLSGGVLFSGPRWGRVRQMQGRVLIASGYDDLWQLQGRLAYPVTTLPYSAAVLALSHILRYYRLGDTSGSSAVDSKSGANGTYTGGFTLNQTALIDDTNGAVLFNGTSGYVNVPTTSLPTGNTSWYAAGWCKVASLPSGNVTLIWLGANTGANKGIWVEMNASGQIVVVLATTGTVITSSAALTAGAAHHVALTWDGTTLTLYVDGASAGTATPGALALTYTSGGASLGANFNNAAPSQFFPGTLDEWAIGSGGILSAADVSNIYDLGISRFANAAYDAQTGAAETVLRHYVDKNAVTAVNNPLGQSRVVAGLLLDTDQGRGSSVTGNARFDQLLAPDGTGLLQQLAQSGGMGFQVVQSGTSLVFRQYVTSDKTASVIFSERMGNLANFSYQEDGPDYSQGGNAIIVGGGGAGVNRLFVTRGDTGSTSRWGLFEGFIDARDTTDVPTLQQRGDAALAQAATQTQFACTLAPQRAVVYGADFHVGDTVTVVIDGVSFANIVREVAITLDSNGAETVTPAVGTPNADTIRQLFGGFVQERQLSALRSTANKLARSQ